MDTALVSIEVVSKIHAAGIDIQAVKRRYFVEDELKPAEVLRILKDHGMRARLKTLTSLDELLKYPAPSIIISRDGTYHVLVGKKDEKIFIFDSIEKKIRELTTEDFPSFWSGEAIAVYPRFTKTEFFLNVRWLFKEFF
jgi:ABC-type bacteriocin/lantibiotic exporter with double-glycine peptidase domain